LSKGAIAALFGLLLSTQAAAETVISPADWPQFGRDPQHTGDNPGQTAIGPANVATLAPHWIVRTLGVRRAEPVVADGTVYSVDNGGVVRALDERTGTLRWSYLTLLPTEIRGTPTVADGTVYVGTMGSGAGAPASGVGGIFYALDVATGSPRWSYRLPDRNSTFSGSPLLDGDSLFTGVAVKYEYAGSCDAGRQLLAFPAAGAEPSAALDLTTPPELGADIWTPPMMDPAGDVYVATGNRCTTPGADPAGAPVSNAESIVKIHPSGTPVAWLRTLWHYGVDSSYDDSDLMGPIYTHGLVVAGGKTGWVYAVDAQTGKLRWSRRLGYQILASPATDGNSIYLTVDYTKPYPCAPGDTCGAVVALGLDGSQRWSIATHRSLLHPHSAAFTAPVVSNGLVFVAYDRGVSALDADTGKVLWRYQTSEDFLSRASIVEGGLFIGDFTGRLYCFTPGGA
jgi:outer membrane protein assembly factor BamB